MRSAGLAIILVCVLLLSATMVPAGVMEDFCPGNHAGGEPLCCVPAARFTGPAEIRRPLQGAWLRTWKTPTFQPAPLPVADPPPKSPPTFI